MTHQRKSNQFQGSGQSLPNELRSDRLLWIALPALVLRPGQRGLPEFDLSDPEGITFENGHQGLQVEIEQFRGLQGVHGVLVDHFQALGGQLSFVEQTSLTEKNQGVLDGDVLLQEVHAEPFETDDAVLLRSVENRHHRVGSDGGERRSAVAVEKAEQGAKGVALHVRNVNQRGRRVAAVPLEHRFEDARTHAEDEFVPGKQLSGVVQLEVDIGHVFIQAQRRDSVVQRAFRRLEAERSG